MKIKEGSRYIVEIALPSKGLFAKDKIYRKYGNLHFRYDNGNANPPSGITILGEEDSEYLSYSNGLILIDIPLKEFKPGKWRTAHYGEKYRILET
jgi:hypothetical protein